jgi:mono/diheme cytochrome c family protein
VIRLFDALLPRPVPPLLYHVLEFIFFVIHFFFVLVTVGTVFFALLALARRLSGAVSPPVDPEHRSTFSSLPVYFASKSLMITFGIAVLLLVMAYYSVPFTGAANLNGGVWVGMIVVLSAALVILQVFDRRVKKPDGADRRALGTGILGLALLLVVPGIFVAFVVTAENPGGWAAVFSNGLLRTPLAGHWAARLLHVYGAAVVIAGMFYLGYARRTGKDVPVTPGILFAALMVQIVIGILLYMSLPQRASGWMNLFVILGAAGAAGFAWLMFSGKTLTARPYVLPALLALILLPMLLARQVNQEDALVPFNERLQRTTRAHWAAVKARAPAGENRFLAEKYDDDNLPQFIFQRSCAFCHGGVGNGQGREAGNLRVRPADLTQMRARPDAVLDLLSHGVPGSAMPYFSVYTGRVLKGLAGYLYDKVGMREAPEAVPVAVSPDDERQAALAYDGRCAACHGSNGRVGPAGAAARPAPRDMTAWALRPEAAFAVITAGTPGTAMQGFGDLPEQVRWALVRRIAGFYGTGKDGAQRKAAKGQ